MSLEALDVEKLGAAFLLWIIVAIAIEEAGNGLFNWKHFKDNFGGKGLKTPIIFILSVLVCAYFKIDIFLAFIASVGIAGESNWLSIGMSALLLTGGSGTAFRVINRLREGKKKIENSST